MLPRRIVPALAASLALWGAGAAEAQPRRDFIAENRRSPAAPVPAERALPGFTREEARSQRVETIAAVPILPRAELRLGRFQVVDLARPGTNLAEESAPNRRRDRSVAAVGFSLRF
jgi:hypothetical protein